MNGETAQDRPAAAGAADGGHVPLLDGVRGLAIILVLFVHLVGIPMPATTRLGSLIGHVSAYGVYGVDLFFVLSGFLITGILYESRNSPAYYRNFYARRMLRIFPLYYASLILLFFVAPALLPGLRENLARTLDRQAWVWLYAVNLRNGIHGTTTLKYVDHFWSLGVEEHFYVVWPFVVRGLSTRALRIAAAAAVVAAVVAGAVATVAGMKPVAVYVLTPFRLDLLCAGAFFALVLRTEGVDALGRVGRRFGLTGAILLLATIVSQEALPSMIEMVRHTRALAVRALVAALFACAVSSGTGAIPRRFFESRALRYFGKYSYGIYVIHAILGVYLMDHGWEAWLYARLHSHVLAVAVYATASLGLTLILSFVSYHLLEMPFLRLKRHFPP